MEELLRQKKEQQLMMAEDIIFIENFQQERNERRERYFMSQEDKYDFNNKGVRIRQSFMGDDNKKNNSKIINKLKNELSIIDFYRETVGRPNADPYSEGISRKTIRKQM